MRLPSDGRDILRDLSTQQYRLDSPDALLLAGVLAGGQEGQLARVSRDGILQVDARSARKQRAWEPYEIRCRTGLDATGQDLFWRFVAKGTTLYYSEPQMCEGCEDLAVWIEPGRQNSGGPLSPLAQFRIFLSEDPDDYCAIAVADKTWTNLASNARPSAWAFSLSGAVTAGYGETRGLRPVMFDVVVRADAASNTALVPFSVRVLGR